MKQQMQLAKLLGCSPILHCQCVQGASAQYLQIDSSIGACWLESGTCHSGSSIGHLPSGKGDYINSSAFTELMELLYSESSTHVATGSFYNIIATFAYSQVEM